MQILSFNFTIDDGLTRMSHFALQNFMTFSTNQRQLKMKKNEQVSSTNLLIKNFK